MEILEKTLRILFFEKHIAPDGESDDYFGYDVSILGNTLVVGTYRNDDNFADSSSAFFLGIQIGTKNCEHFYAWLN